MELAGEVICGTLRMGNTGASRYYRTSPTQTRERRYSRQEAALTSMDQLSLPPRRASANTTLVRDVYVSCDERSHKLTTSLCL